MNKTVKDLFVKCVYLFLYLVIYFRNVFSDIFYILQVRWSSLYCACGVSFHNDIWFS